MVRRYLFQTIGRWYFIKAIGFPAISIFLIFDAFTSAYDIGISADTGNRTYSCLAV